jgi:hypothetical protein
VESLVKIEILLSLRFATKANRATPGVGGGVAGEFKLPPQPVSPKAKTATRTEMGAEMERYWYRFIQSPVIFTIPSGYRSFVKDS